MVKASVPRWYVLCEAGLVMMLERSAEVMDQWLLLGEGKFALHLLQKGCFSLASVGSLYLILQGFPSRSVTIPCFFVLAFPAAWKVASHSCDSKICFRLCYCESFKLTLNIFFFSCCIFLKHQLSRLKEVAGVQGNERLNIWMVTMRNVFTARCLVE